MITYYDPFKKEIVELILISLQMNFVDFDLIYNALSLPPEFRLGQAALPCFLLAKIQKKSPNLIAQNIADHINASNKITITHAVAANAYVNFHCNFESILNIEKNRDFNKNYLKPKKFENIIVEYSQPNTHKTLHVGHLRCLVLGDALCNILEYVGHKVSRVTYPGDIGTHVAKVIWYLTHPKKIFPEHHKAQWLGEMYAQADALFASYKGTVQEQNIQKIFGQILTQISDEHGPYYDLWKTTRAWSLDYLKNVYDWLDCHFDTWSFESEFDKPSKEFVLKKFGEGFFVKDEGAIGIDLSEYHLGFVLYLKSDGNGLYITKDLLFLLQKFSNPKITKSIYVVDARQKLHFEQLFKTAELMGCDKAKDSFHLSYETVNTETGEPFSSRSPKGLEIFEIKNKMEEKIKTEYLERYRGEWNDSHITKVAEDVCKGALKYGLLRVDNNTQVHFSLSEWLKLEGDTGPYLQYVHARCVSILEKVSFSDEPIKKYVLSEESEKKLLFFIHRFSEICLQSSNYLKPSLVANYLFDLAKLFNRFYESCPIINSEPAIKYTRLELVKLTRKTIFTGLKLLGIESPERM